MSDKPQPDEPQPEPVPQPEPAPDPVQAVQRIIPRPVNLGPPMAMHATRMPPPRG